MYSIRITLRMAWLVLPTMLSLVMLGEHSSAQRGGIPGEEGDWYPLGGIEALGDTLDSAGPQGSPAIEIKEVHPRGLADLGGLKVGDLVVGIGGRRFKTSGTQLIATLEKDIEKLEAKKKASRKPNVIALDVMSGGKRLVREIPVRFLGPHASSCPKKCGKCGKILERAANYLKRQQGGDGSFPASMANMDQQVVTAALAGLAWRGVSKKKYAAEIRKALNFCVRNAGKEDLFARQGEDEPNWNQTNWALAYSTILLAELKAAKMKGDITKSLKEFVRTLCRNQEKSGGWAHGPGGPNALDYLELEIMSNLALGGIGMARRVKVKVDETRVSRGVTFVKQCTKDGGVAYSPLPGQFGHGDPGRTAGAFWALRQLGRQDKVLKEMSSFYGKHMDDLPNGHASPVMHILNGALASALLGPGSFKNYWRIYRPYLMASREYDGSFNARPNAESRQLKSNSDRGNGAPFVTAHYIIAMCAGQGRYTLLDRM